MQSIGSRALAVACQAFSSLLADRLPERMQRVSSMYTANTYTLQPLDVETKNMWKVSSMRMCIRIDI